MLNSITNFLNKFSNEEKSKFFDDFVSRCLGSGTLNIQKTDAEVVLFHYYLENIKKCTKQTCESVGTGKNPLINPTSDYSISFELGITQAKVRSLKEKEYIYYKSDCLHNNWMDSFKTLLDNVKLNKKTGNIELLIADKGLLIELRNYIEELGFL